MNEDVVTAEQEWKRLKKAQKIQEQYGTGVVWWAKRQNGHKVKVYRCINGKMHDYEKRSKTYKLKELKFLNEVSYYTGPDPKELMKE